MYKKISQYQKLIYNPYKMHHKEIKENAREVIFYVVSCMCDNKYNLRFRKNDNGEFKMSGMGFSLRNFQFGFKQGGIEPFEIEWKADEGDWIGVKNMINSGTVKVEKVISR
jgi:hypothetical protein